MSRSRGVQALDRDTETARRRRQRILEIMTCYPPLGIQIALRCDHPCRSPRELYNTLARNERRGELGYDHVWNALIVLQRRGYIERAGRGLYHLTPTGRDEAVLL